LINVIPALIGFEELNIKKQATALDNYAVALITDVPSLCLSLFVMSINFLLFPCARNHFERPKSHELKPDG